MNRNLDGTLLTTADLEKIALDHGLITQAKLDDLHADAHNAALFRGAMSVLTAETRLDLFFSGKLKLDTRIEEMDR